MCTPLLAIAAVSAVATIGGAVMSASNQASVAAAQRTAANETQQAQNAGFMQRLQAQSDQQQRDYATQQSAIQARADAQSQLETSQNQATADREAQIASSNEQAKTIGSQAQQAVTDAASKINPAQAQAAQQQQIVAMATAGPGGGAATGPTAAAPADAAGNPAGVTSSNNDTASAIATRLAQAAAQTRDYAGKRATVASYGAPLAQIANVTQGLNTTSLPLADRERQIQTALPVQLGPSTVGYQTAGNYYKSLLDVIQARTQGRLKVSDAIGVGDITTADLQQADIGNAAQNQAAVAAWKAASDPLPGILSAVGQVGSYGSGYLGAGSSLGLNNSPGSFLNSIKTWGNTPFV
jgi:hypothetical protein